MQSRRPDMLKYLENYREVARRVKEIVLRNDPSAEVYVFGSVLSGRYTACLLYTSPSPRDLSTSRMPSSA